MKKHLAIVCGVFYPQPSATGLCVRRYAELLQQAYEIDAVFLRSAAQPVEGTVDSGFCLHSVCGRRLQAEYSAAGLGKKLLHRLGQAQVLTCRLGNLGWFRAKACAALDKIHAKNPLDAVLSVCSPFAAHLAGADFCRAHPKVRHVAYTVDLFSADTAVRPLFHSRKGRRALERKTLMQADALLLSQQIYDTCPTLYAGHPNCATLPYVLPPVGLPAADGRWFSQQGVHCVYAGRFYEQLRDPAPLLQAFAALKGENLVLHLFSVGCESVVSSFAGACENIVLHRQVSQRELQQVYANADVLVGVGNRAAEFLPSKTYEYIAAAKPIVFFNPPGGHNAVLDTYPDCLQLDAALPVQEAAARLRSFLLRPHGAIVQEQITDCYRQNLPQTVKQQLLRALEP